MQKITIEQAQKLSKTSTEVITWRPDCQNTGLKFHELPADMHYAMVGVKEDKK